MKFTLLLLSAFMITACSSSPKEKYEERQADAKERYEQDLKEAQEEYRESQVDYQKEQAIDMIEDSDEIKFNEDKGQIQVDD